METELMSDPLLPTGYILHLKSLCFPPGDTLFGTYFHVVFMNKK